MFNDRIMAKAFFKNFKNPAVFLWNGKYFVRTSRKAKTFGK